VTTKNKVIVGDNNVAMTIAM